MLLGFILIIGGSAADEAANVTSNVKSMDKFQYSSREIEYSPEKMRMREEREKKRKTCGKISWKILF